MPKNANTDETYPDFQTGGLEGVLAEQNRQATVMAGMQRDVGDQSVSMARMQSDVTALGGSFEGLRKILEGETGIIVRMAVVEKGLQAMVDNLRENRQAMKEHRDAVEADIKQILSKFDSQSEANQERQNKAIWAIVATLLSALVAAATAIINLLHHP